MPKLANNTRDYLSTRRGFRPPVVAQNGIAYDPFTPADSFLDIGKSFGTSYLGSKTFNNAYYADKFPNDPETAKRKAEQAALTSGVLGGVRSIFSQIKQNRDYQAEMDRIRKLQAKNYYRVPVDNYAYNENVGNAYNNTAYKYGGSVGKKKCQNGGLLNIPASDTTQDTFAKYGQPSVMPLVQKDAYDTIFKGTIPGVDTVRPELRQEFNVLDASARLNTGLLEQSSTKAISKVQPFRERKFGGLTSKRYQSGGAVDPYDSTTEDSGPSYYVQPSTEVYDSTEPDYPSAQDELPMNENGYDLSKFTPTLGGAPLTHRIDNNSLQGVINQIAQKESGGRYDIVNTKGGKNAIFATGKYQFVPKYWHKQIAEFQGTQGKSMNETMERFRQSPQTQDAFMQHVVSDVYMPAVNRLLPLARAYGLGQNELIKMIHYRGISDTQKRLEKGDFRVSASEKAKYSNPDILSYIRN